MNAASRLASTAPAQDVYPAPLAHLRWGPVDARACVVLVHGIGGGRQAWGDDLSGTGRALAAAGYGAVAVDLPGYGASAPPATNDIAGLAAGLRELIVWLHCERIALVGHSLGGMVVQELMLQPPSCVQALVLCATSPAFGKPGGAWQAEFVAQRLAPLDAGRGMSALAPGLALGMASPSAPHDAVARAALLMSGVPEATYRRALQALIDFDRRDVLAALRVPVLCLAGSDDRTAPPGMMQKMAAEVPEAEFRVMNEVGHLANLEAPGVFNDALLEFLLRRFPLP